MRILIARWSDLGRFPSFPPVPGAELIEWTEARSGKVRLGKLKESGEREPAERMPDVQMRCRAWALEVDTLDDFMRIADEWRTNHAASFEMTVRDRGRWQGPKTEKDFVITLQDHDPSEAVPDGRKYMQDWFGPIIIEELGEEQEQPQASD